MGSLRFSLTPKVLAIIGGSGAGKTTLLDTALSSAFRNKNDSGLRPIKGGVSEDVLSMLSMSLASVSAHYCSWFGIGATLFEKLGSFGPRFVISRWNHDRDIVPGMCCSTESTWPLASAWKTLRSLKLFVIRWCSKNNPYISLHICVKCRKMSRLVLQGLMPRNCRIGSWSEDQALFRRSCAYVAQSDACCPTLTAGYSAWEILQFLSFDVWSVNLPMGFRQDVRAMTGRVFGDELNLLNLPGAFRRNRGIIRDGSWSCLTTVGRLDRSKHFWCAPSVWFLDVYNLYMTYIYIYMNETEWVILSQHLHCAYVGCCAKLASHEKNISNIEFHSESWQTFDLHSRNGGYET